MNPSNSSSVSSSGNPPDASLRSDGLTELSGIEANRLHQVLTEDVCRRLGIFVLPADFRLSVVIPVFNEVNTVLQVIERVRRTALPLEIILVDDGSIDGTRDKLAAVPASEDLKIILHDHNRGKGAALRTGFQHATGQAVVVQDADLEYDPDDFRFLIQPIVEGEADVVYGTRYGHHDRQVPPLWHVWVNRLITHATDKPAHRTLFERCGDLLQSYASRADCRTSANTKRESLWH